MGIEVDYIMDKDDDLNYHIIDKELFESLKEMITSKNEVDQKFVLTILLNADRNDHDTMMYTNELNEYFLEFMDIRDLVKLRNDAYLAWFNCVNNDPNQ